jgi:hypothetical protein
VSAWSGETERKIAALRKKEQAARSQESHHMAKAEWWSSLGYYDAANRHRQLATKAHQECVAANRAAQRLAMA